MDSQWINQQATKMNDHDDHHKNISGKNKQVDLTLKLGLPHSLEKNNQPHFDFAPLAPNQANLNIHGSYSQSQGINHLEMVNHGVDANANNTVGQSLNAKDSAWPSKLASLIHEQYMQSNGYAIGPFLAGSSSMAPPLPMYTNPYYYNNFNFNPNPNFLLPSTPTMSDYTLLDIPARRAIACELKSSSSSRKNGLRRQYSGSYIDPYKRCTNYNCNTNDTPMWRKGPLGPKTLCNACGIKYRKEEEKRKAKEAAKNQESNNEFG